MFLDKYISKHVAFFKIIISYTFASRIVPWFCKSLQTKDPLTLTVGTLSSCRGGRLVIVLKIKMNFYN